MCRFTASIIAFTSLKGINGIKGWDSELGITKNEAIGSLSHWTLFVLKSHSALFVNILGGMRLLSLNHFHRGTPSPIQALDVHMSHHTKTSTLPPSKGYSVNPCRLMTSDSNTLTTPNKVVPSKRSQPYGITLFLP